MVLYTTSCMQMIKWKIQFVYIPFCTESELPMVILLKNVGHIKQQHIKIIYPPKKE